jgi:hypothetical protein
VAGGVETITRGFQVHEWDDLVAGVLIIIVHNYKRDVRRIRTDGFKIHDRFRLQRCKAAEAGGQGWKLVIPGRPEVDAGRALRQKRRWARARRRR